VDALLPRCVRGSHSCLDSNGYDRPVGPRGIVTTIATGLSFLSAMTFVPDGKLYVSNFGSAGAPRAGEIWQIDVPCDNY
jgi:hypothetical protein